MQQVLAKIYQPAKTAMQSGKAKTAYWLLEYTPNAAMTPEPLMGWNTQSDTLQQLKLKFATKDEAIAYAEKKAIRFEVLEPKQRKITGKSYASNFANDRSLPFAQTAQKPAE